MTDGQIIIAGIVVYWKKHISRTGEISESRFYMVKISVNSIAFAIKKTYII